MHKKTLLSRKNLEKDRASAQVVGKECRRLRFDVQAIAFISSLACMI